MKKIKLFALAAFAMLSINAFADESATKVFTYEYSGLNATITGFVADLDDASKASVKIPEYVAHPTLKNTDGTPVQYYVVGIAAEAFKDQPISSISFTAPVPDDEYDGISSIGAGAFAGTKIQKLDLSNTVIEDVYNLFGTLIATEAKDDKVNATLTSVTLPATALWIAPSAFENCTKLSTVNLTKATGLAYIGAQAFAGCPLTALDLSKNTLITGLNANTLYDGTRFKSSSALKTVTLHKLFENLNNNLQGAAKLTSVTGHIFVKSSKTTETALFDLSVDEFKGCAALTTFDTKFIKTFAAGCFDGCASLAKADISAATTIGARAFAGTALTSVTFPAANTGLTAIGEQAYFECAKLATATLAVAADKTTTIEEIGAQAFAYTAIESFTIPEPANNPIFSIGAKAFAGTPITAFTWKAAAYDGATDGTGQFIADDVFSKCSNVKFYTTKTFVTGWQGAKANHAVGEALANGPTNSKFDTGTVDPNIKFSLTAYSNNPNKFYVKWFGGSTLDPTWTDIKVKKSDCKVYAGFLEGDGSLAMIQYKANNKGIITIANGDAALIITTNKELTYQKGYDGDASTSWMGIPSAAWDADQALYDGQNALKYCTEATTRGTLENHLTDDTFYIYGWMKVGGFQKIAKGTTIPAGTLFAFAKEPVAGARMTVKWYDENGNLEAETTAIDEEATAINGVKAAEAEGQRYNVAGQKVSAAYKGLVIKDGKKYMQK